MIVSVTLRNAEGEAWQRDYVEEKMGKLRKYLEEPIEVKVVLSVEKFRNTAEINLSSNGLNINAKEEEKDMRLAIDKTIEKIERQIKKTREKMRERKNSTPREESLGSEEVSSPEVYPAAKIAEFRKIVVSPMTLDDALLEIETKKQRFLVYRDATTMEINILLSKDDGSYSLLEVKT